MKKPLQMVILVVLTAIITSNFVFPAVKVGDVVLEEVQTPHPYRQGNGVSWEKVFYRQDAGYIAIHFSDFNLAPGDYVEISSPGGQFAYRYEGQGKLVRGGETILSTFWAAHIPGDTAIVRLYSAGPKEGWGVAVDKWAHGYERKAIRALLESDNQSLGIMDLKKWTKDCEASAMNVKSKGEVRLLVNGTIACTGFLIGSEGDVMTDASGIGSQTDADNADFEFMAENTGSMDDSDSTGWDRCQRKVEADNGILVKGDGSPGYSIIHFPVKEVDRNPNDDISTVNSGYIWEFSLWTGRRQCAAYPPGDACEAHEWRTTFEAIAKDASGVNRINEAGWDVDFYAAKSQYTPSSWIGPYSSHGCYDYKSLFTIDGEWYEVIEPLSIWVKTRIRNTSLGIDVSVKGKCNFSYPESSPTAQYNCSVDYLYGVGQRRLGVVTISNHPPDVNAGSNKDITWPSCLVLLGGQVSDDGYPDPPSSFTHQWSKYSGPGYVYFINAASLNAYAGFSTPGTYVLRLTASDGELESHDDMTVTVYDEVSPTISGPSTVYVPDKSDPIFTETWTSSVSGGQSPYTYKWYRKVGTGSYYLVGTSSSYSKTYRYIGSYQDWNVTLKLEVTDANNQTGVITKSVFEDGPPHLW